MTNNVKHLETRDLMKEYYAAETKLAEYENATYISRDDHEDIYDWEVYLDDVKDEIETRLQEFDNASL